MSAAGGRQKSCDFISNVFNDTRFEGPVGRGFVLLREALSGDFLEWRYPAPAYAGIHNHTGLTHPPSSSPFTLTEGCSYALINLTIIKGLWCKKKRNPLFFGESSVRAFIERQHRVFKVYVN